VFVDILHVAAGSLLLRFASCIGITNCSSVFEHVFQRSLPYGSSLIVAAERSASDASAMGAKVSCLALKNSPFTAALELCKPHTLGDL